MANRPFQAVHRQVHAAEPPGFIGLLHAADRQVAGRVTAVGLHEAGALHIHAARTAGRIEQSSGEGLRDLGDQHHQGRRRKELTPFLPLAAGELAEEVFVDPTEGVELQ